MSDNDVCEPAKKKTRRPRALSAATTNLASNLKNIDEPALVEMHANIKQTTAGNHALMASATRASSVAPPASAASAGDQAHSRELTRIVFKAGFAEIGVDSETVEACCQAHPNRFQRPQSNAEREEMARRFANKPLKDVVGDILLRLRHETPNITRADAVKRADEALDDELHRLQHVYELTHGVPGLDGIEQRFKAWLGVRPGATQNELEAALREKHPDERPSRITGMARDKMLSDERKKKSAYQIHVSDDKIQQMLLRAYANNNDAEAGAIYTQFRERQIRLSASSAEDAQRRLEEMHLDFRARAQNAMRASEKSEYQARAAAMQEDVAQSTLLTVKAANPETGKLSNAEGVVVEPGIHDGGVYVRAYNQDLSAAPEKVRANHCAAMASELMSSINLMAELLAVAPPDAVFGVATGDECGDAIDNLYALLHEATDELDADRNAGTQRHGRLSSETLHLYLDQWQRVQSESQSDIDRELVQAHKHDERSAIVSALKKTGLTTAQIDADLAFGVRPNLSDVYRSIASVSHREKFAIACEEAAVASKLRQKLDQQATAMARDANMAADGGGGGGGGGDGERMTKEEAMKLIFENAARRLPVTDRAYRADFLREPAGPEFFERPCVFGESCIARVKRSVFPIQQLHSNLSGTGGGSKAVNSGFICREFLLPDQLAEVQATKKLPETIRMCLPCNIYRTTLNVMQFAQQQQGCDEREPLTLAQDHCVMIEQMGEYSRECTLPHTFGNKKTTGVVRPFQAYSDSNYAYSWTVRHGKRLRCLVETDASVFRLLSASATRI